MIYNQFNESVFFVYIGDNLPDYARSSLVIAQRNSGLKVHLIGNESIRKKVKSISVEFTAIEDFYEPEYFSNARIRLSSNAEFRNGFWVKSLERFFVLEQYARKTGRHNIFHAELDQLLFGADQLIQGIESTLKKGLFVPFHSKDSAVASVLYVNDLESLTSLTSYASSSGYFRNEMSLIAKWATQEPNKVFGLPTLLTVAKDFSQVLPEGVVGLLHENIGGITDAAQLGQWIGGVDPRNIPLTKTPLTKFIDPPQEWLLSGRDLESTSFQLSTDHAELLAKFGGHKIKVFNLHIHSKIHSYLLKSNDKLSILINKANQNSAIYLKGTRKVQVNYFLSKAWSLFWPNPTKLIFDLIRRFNLILGIRPTSLPFISGDSFRSISDFVWESNSKKIDVEIIQIGDIIFCESHLLQELTLKVLSQIEVSVVVLLGNSDLNHNSETQLFGIIEMGHKVFAQNMEKNLKGCTVLPIGLENAWRMKHGRIRLRHARNSSNFGRVNRIMWGFSVETNPELRVTAANDLTQSRNADKMENLSPEEHRSALRKYAFVASPPGNGLDTHRIWEAFYFKCIPIVLRSYMSEEYESLGLPIWIVDTYREILDLDEEFLESKYESLSSKFGSNAIWADFWIKRIREASISLKESKGPKSLS